MQRFISFVALGFAVAWTTGLTSCSETRAGAGNEDRDEVAGGTLRLPLRAVSESGKIYRLRNGLFPVARLGTGPSPLPPPGSGAFGPVPVDAGPASGGRGFGGGFGTAGFGESGGTAVGGGGGGGLAAFFNTEENPDRLVMEAFLTPAVYSIELLPGWFIEQVDEQHDTVAVKPEAVLLSDAVQVFGIEDGGETFVLYVFEVDGERVSFGRGRFILGIDIVERQGGFCGDGRVQPGEDCDTFDLGGQTCSSVTMGALPNGFLTCTPFCTFDLGFCSGGGFDGGSGGLGTGGFPSEDDSGAGGAVGAFDGG